MPMHFAQAQSHCQKGRVAQDKMIMPIKHASQGADISTTVAALQKWASMEMDA